MLRTRARGPIAPPGRVARAHALERFAGFACVVVLALLPRPAAADTASAPGGIGVRTSFDQLLERARQRATGERIALGANPNLRNPLLEGADPVATSSLVYSPWLETVFEIGGPGWVPTPPEFYFADGTYPVYDPPTFDDPSVRVRAVPRDAFERERIAAWRKKAYASRQLSARTAQREAAAGQGITVTVPIRMPGALAEVFGRGATSLKVTGRENLAFAGESRRLSNFIANESGRGQSLFPRLDMKQELQVKLEGTIGDKVHVQVDHNSAGIGADANRINIFYQGYDDDIVQRVDLGGTNLALPGANLVSFAGGGGHQGLFGIKTEMRLGGVQMRVIASKEEADVQSGVFTPTGGTPRPAVINENGFARDRFFFYEKPDTSYTTLARYLTYGIPVGLLLERTEINNIRVFVDDQNGQTLPQRPFSGFAVADLPAGLDTVAIRQRWEAAALEARYPAAARDGHWRELAREELGWIIFTSGDQQKVLGFFLRNGAAGRSDAIGLAINTPADLVGSVREAQGQTPEVRLRLIRHPDQDTGFYTHPTALYMMRHVYVLGSTDVTNLDVKILRDNTGQQNPDVPAQLPNSSYMHMFGLDDLNEGNQAQPDGRFDFANPNLLDRAEGLLFMPGVRPFSPPEPIVIQRLIGAGVDPDTAQVASARLFPAEERVAAKMYTLPSTAADLPRGVYHLEATSTGVETEIRLPQDIIEGSEVVRLDGRTLQRGLEYDIESFAGGKITLKGDALTALNPTSKIEVTYQFMPLFGGGKSTLLGVSAEYELGSRARFNSVWLYESTGGATRRARLGEEPSRTVVGDLNGVFRFEPRWMTRLVNLLPFTNATAPSQFNVGAEVAVSVPNPNTRKTAYVDDLEGADESDEINVSRTTWSWASIPIDTPARRDTTLRVPVAFYNPVGAVRRGHLNPTLSEREVNDGLTVLELGFDRERAAALAGRPDAKALWSGIMRSFGTAGLDLTRTKSIEFWLNDGVGDPHLRHGKLHLDFGEMSEDFIFFPNGSDPTNPRFNREAPTASEFQPQRDDKGWDGIERGCRPGDLPRDCVDLTRQVPFGSECYIPEAVNCDHQHYLADGSEGNNNYDTEDLNNNGRFDDFNSYFALTLDLADLTYVVTDVNPTYANDPREGVQRFKNGFAGWRKYRIDFERVAKTIRTDTGSSPSLRKISYLRIWFEDDAPDASLFQTNLQLYELRFTRNQWIDLGVFAVDSTQVAPAPNESFSVGTINNKEDSAIYELPPDAVELDTQGVQAREQSLRVDFTGLQPGHEVVAERQLAGTTRGLDFTQYGRLTYFVHYPPSPATSPVDSAEFFFRIGADTLNYYEVAHVIPAKGRWVELNVDFEQLTGLKFPEDYPGAELEYLQRGTQKILQVTAPTVDARDPTIPLRVTLRGSPSLTAITRFFVGVRNRERAAAPGGGAAARPVSGEVWFDNVRLDNPERAVGLAQNYSMTGKFSDVFDLTAQLRSTGADFRGLRQRAGSGSDQSGLSTSLRLSDVGRLVPTAGFVIPVSYNYAHDETRFKFASQSDTRNTEKRKYEQRTERVRTGVGFSVTKRPSRFWLSRLTFDRLSFSYSKSQDKAREYIRRDTTESRNRSLTYDLSPRDRTLPLWRKARLSYLPSNLKFSVQETAGDGVHYTVSRRRGPGTTVIDSLVRQQSSPQKSLTVTASAALRPLQILNVRYTFTEARNYRQTHPSNEIERLRFFGYDLGLPTGRNEALSFDLTPRRFRFNFSSSFNDQRTVYGTQRPETHQASGNRSMRLSFDFGLHRRILNRIVPPRRSAAAPGRGAPRPGAPPPRAAPPPEEAPPGFESEPDSLAPPPHREDLAPPAGAGADTLGPQPAPSPPGGGAPREPLPGPNATAPADTTHAHRPSPLDPIVGLLHIVANVEPFKIEVSDGRNSSYIGLPDAPTGAFRYGVSNRSGIHGPRFETPPQEDVRRSLDLATGVPLRGALRLGVRYKLDTSVRRSRTYDSQDVLRGINADHTQETTFPNLDLAINNLERVRLFGKRLERSSITFGYSRAKSLRYNTNQLPGGPVLEGSSRNETGRSSFAANWTGQWKRGVSSSLSFNQTTSSNVTPGPIRRDALQRSAQGTMRFRLAPAGGLRVPFLGRYGHLKSGMDISVTGAYTTESRQSFLDPTRPAASVPESRSSSMQFGVRSDYTLSRNMTGGLEVGYSRNRNDLQDQTVNALRLGFNISFLF